MPLIVGKQTAPKNPGGRPNSIVADDATLETLTKLGGMNCSRAEAAFWFGCTEKTFITFLQTNPNADLAFERGRGLLKISLKRKQVQMALAGNATMLVWTGKNILGQKDKIEHAGDSSAPVRHVIEYIITDPVAQPDDDGPADDGT